MFALKIAVKAIAAPLALFASAATFGAGVPGQGTWESTLLGRDINGNAVSSSSVGAVFLYDTTLNLTWLRDFTIGYGQSWSQAGHLASQLVVGGYAGWRLPNMVDIGLPGCAHLEGQGTSPDCGYNSWTTIGSTVYSEMASLWYETLGNTAPCPETLCPGVQASTYLTNPGPFTSIESPSLHYIYWLQQEYAPNPNVLSWYFSPVYGEQSRTAADSGFSVTAVRPGDVVTAVPEPTVNLLLLAGLGVTIARAGLGKRKRQKVTPDHSLVSSAIGRAV